MRKKVAIDHAIFCTWLAHEGDIVQAAVQNYYDFHIGVYADPLFFGNFPASVLAAKIPGLSLTPDEQKLLNGTVDYFALNFCKAPFSDSAE